MKSYNPVHGKSEEERVELTANRVGLKLSTIPLVEVLDREIPNEKSTRFVKEGDAYTEGDEGKIF